MYVFLLADEIFCKCTVVGVPRNDYHSVWATDIPPRETVPAFPTGVTVEATSCTATLCQCGNISPNLPYYTDSFMSKSARVIFAWVKSIDIANTRVRDSDEDVSRAKSWQCYIVHNSGAVPGTVHGVLGITWYRTPSRTRHGAVESSYLEQLTVSWAVLVNNFSSVVDSSYVR